MTPAARWVSALGDKSWAPGMLTTTGLRVLLVNGCAVVVCDEPTEAEALVCAAEEWRRRNP